MNIEPRILQYKIPVGDIVVSGVLEDMSWYSVRFWLNVHFQEAVMLTWAEEAEKLRKKNDCH